MKDRYIGVTGITSKEDVAVITEALDGHVGMYGILMKKEILEGRPRKGRWPYVEDVPAIMEKVPAGSLATIHWCDSRKICNESVILNSVIYAGDKCNAIQLNLVYPPAKLFGALKEEGLKTIFQIEDCMFEDPIIMRKKMQPYQDVVDYVIIDQSMGAGIPINPDISKAVASELKDLGFGIVFAGGLNETRVKDISDLINKYNASVDAEGQLMKDSKDGLDHTKVKNYIKSAVSVMKNKK